MKRAEAARINGKLGGRPASLLSYDLAMLGVGDRIFIPWRTNAQGARLASQQSIHKAIKRAPGTFLTIPISAGLLVRRRA